MTRRGITSFWTDVVLVLRLCDPHSTILRREVLNGRKPIHSHSWVRFTLAAPPTSCVAVYYSIETGKKVFKARTEL